MRDDPPNRVYLTDAALNGLWASNHHSLADHTPGLALLYGYQDPLTVTLVIDQAERPEHRRAAMRDAEEKGLVLVGQSRAVTETTILTNAGDLNDDPAHFHPPPVGVVFLLRHRLGPFNQFYATTYDGTRAVQVPIRLTK